MIACGMSHDELARNWIVLTEQGEPFDVCQWMRVDTKIAWELEYDTHLCDAQPFESKIFSNPLPHQRNQVHAIMPPKKPWTVPFVPPEHCIKPSRGLSLATTSSDLWLGTNLLPAQPMTSDYTRPPADVQVIEHIECIRFCREDQFTLRCMGGEKMLECFDEFRSLVVSS